MIRKFIEDRSASFAMTTALLVLPVVVSIGCSIDYSMALNTQNQFQHAADIAAVSALAEQSVGVISALTNGNTGRIIVAEKDAQAWFKSNLDRKLSGYLSDYSISVDRNGAQFTSEVVFKASIPTSFMNIIGIDHINVKGSATASYVPATYTDFFLMLDNSPSMGLAATTSDINLLESNNGGCAFACHIDGSATDAYALAKRLGVTTRIQLVAQATQKMTDKAKSVRKYPDQYRMALYSMGELATKSKLTEVAELSSNLDSIKASAGLVNLMSIPFQNYNNDQLTDLLGNLIALEQKIGEPHRLYRRPFGLSYAAMAGASSMA